ncbi:MAG: NADH-quinone oxidoreductase subunit J [Sphingobacteriia bacterium]|nr:NADH-quinone oxidoreductase subunit J [Sphingobacteriia bacterium]
MVELFSSMAFYLFASLMIIFSLMVVTLKNPVHSVLSLIMVFFNAAALFVLIGAEFVAMTLIIVYVGAVAVLFLFVVMMLDININELRKGFSQNIPFALSVGVILLIDLFVVITKSFARASETNFFYLPALPATTTNTHQLGSVLYTDYIFPFQIAGIILLVAMIGSIVLTLRSRPNVKKQDIANQMTRTKENSIKVISVKTGEGINGISQ